MGALTVQRSRDCKTQVSGNGETKVPVTDPEAGASLLACFPLAKCSGLGGPITGPLSSLGASLFATGAEASNFAAPACHRE